MKYLKSQLLSKFENIEHFFTTKECGNIAFHVGDNEKNVIVNHKKIADDFDYELNNLVWMKQIHSDKVEIVNEDDTFSNPNTCDALITNQTDKPIMVMVADCTPILLYDPQNRVIAVVHAGRKGAFENIVSKTIIKMQNEFHSKSENLIAVLGASIKSCCYEVGAEINEEAKNLNLQYAITKNDFKYYLDVNKIIKQQLQDMKIKDKNIEEFKECTCCNSDRLYSYRKDNKCGRFSGVIMIKIVD